MLVWQGYYNSGTNPICQKCHYSCKTCSTSGECSDCDPDKFRAPLVAGSLCACMDGYFDVASNELCSKCHSSCKKCIDVATKCTDC